MLSDGACVQVPNVEKKKMETKENKNKKEKKTKILIKRLMKHHFINFIGPRGKRSNLMHIRKTSHFASPFHARQGTIS